MPSCRCCYITCIVFYECRLPGKVKFLNCKWSSYNCTQKKSKKEPRWNFSSFWNPSFVKIWESATNVTFISFVFLFYGIYILTQLSWHAVQRDLSKTCEHIFMLIALFEYYILLLASVCFGHNKVFDFIRTQCNHTSLRLTPISLQNIFICPFDTKEGIFFFKYKNSIDINLEIINEAVKLHLLRWWCI